MALEIIIKARYEDIDTADGEDADAAMEEITKATVDMLASTFANQIFVDDAVVVAKGELNQAQKEALDIIDNFILHFTSDDDERASMLTCAMDYVESDHALIGEPEKFYIGTMSEIVGERGFEARFVFKTTGDPAEYMEKLASTYRGGTKQDADGEWWSGDILISPEAHKEVTEEDFNVLVKHMVKL
jgi:hypothetical protein